MKNFIFALLLFSIGCSPIVTLHPLSENKSDFIFKKELMGQWKTSKEAKPIFFIDTVSSDSGPVYHILTPNHTTLGKKSFDNKFWFFAKLIKLNNDYFLDTWLDINHLNVDTANYILPNNEETDYNPLIYPGHHIIHLKFINPNQLQFQIFDWEKIIKLLKERKLNLNYTTIKNPSSDGPESIILLDKPKRLQDFLKQSIKLGLFIDDKDILLKVSEDGIYTVFESEPYIKPLKNNN